MSVIPMPKTRPSPFCADLIGNSPLSIASTPLRRDIRTVLESMGVEARRQVDETVTLSRALLHRRVRGATQLGSGKSQKMRIKITTTDEIPQSVHEWLERLPRGLLWSLFHRAMLQQTHRGLRAIVDNHDDLISLMSPVPSRAMKGHLEQSLRFMQQLDADVLALCREMLDELMRVPGDILGSYTLKTPHIQLRWFVIWLVAAELGVSVQDLTVVVLAHELAHFYCHHGADADGIRWETHEMARTDIHILEGMAQYITKHVVDSLSTQDSRWGPQRAFEALLTKQSEPYRCFLNWVPNHPRRAEVVRNALTYTRAENVRGYPPFLEAVDRFSRAHHSPRARVKRR